jgi:tetratricopeptide (TPR) repeat protein
LAVRILEIDPYVRANEIDEALRILEELSKGLEPPLDNLIHFGYLIVYAETGEIDKAREAKKGAYAIVEGFGQENLLANVFYANGRIFEWQEQYDSAIVQFNKFHEMLPTSYFIHAYIARCYRELREYDMAEEEILKGLKFRPFGPTNNYEAALIYLDMGEKEKAKEYLQRAVDTWKDADNDYELATQAKKKLRDMQ